MSLVTDYKFLSLYDVFLDVESKENLDLTDWTLTPSGQGRDGCPLTTPTRDRRGPLCVGVNTPEKKDKDLRGLNDEGLCVLSVPKVFEAIQPLS